MSDTTWVDDVVDDHWSRHSDPAVQWVETYVGIKFHLDEPNVDIRDIAQALGNKCRFNGWCKEFYSVAEHSILVSNILFYLGGNPFEGLMHDAEEAILWDCPSPWKPVFPEYVAKAKALDKYIRAQYGLPEEHSQLCKDADLIALFLEADELVRTSGLRYVGREEWRPRAMELKELFPLFMFTPKEATDAFLRAFEVMK